MVREDLINSAISFLQDPSVANAPLDKRISFLKSKNLTQEEIDISLQRASSGAEPQPSSVAPSAPPSNYAYNQPPPPGYGYNAYPGGYWQQPPPPELPRRDWRDWFIMATVTGGIGYSCYFLAKRYIYPLIAPPTAPQLEADKAAIDAEFRRAFELLDQLASDTASLKASEEARTARLDAALAEVEGVIGELKAASRKREEDNRRLGEDVRGLRDLIPKAMEGAKEAQDNRLRELGNELKSLKTLVGNRLGQGGAQATTSGGGGSRPSSVYGAQGSAAVNGDGAAASTPSLGSTAGGSSTPTESKADGQSDSSSTPAPERPQSASAYQSRFGNGNRSIPAWQMAAAKKNQESSENKENESKADGATA